MKKKLLNTYDKLKIRLLYLKNRLCINSLKPLQPLKIVYQLLQYYYFCSFLKSGMSQGKKLL